VYVDFSKGDGDGDNDGIGDGVGVGVGEKVGIGVEDSTVFIVSVGGIVFCWLICFNSFLRFSFSPSSSDTFKFKPSVSLLRDVSSWLEHAEKLKIIDKRNNKYNFRKNATSFLYHSNVISNKDQTLKSIPSFKAELFEEGKRTILFQVQFISAWKTLLCIYKIHLV
jgi:hypothetical protein